jgi:hypothetical protein
MFTVGPLPEGEEGTGVLKQVSRACLNASPFLVLSHLA